MHISFFSNGGNVYISVTVLMVFLEITIPSSGVNAWPPYNLQTNATGFLEEGITENL